MSYSIHIGNAEIESGFEDGEFYASWSVRTHKEEDAPNFEGDDMTGNSNGRHPGYGQWADFLKEVDMYDLFLNRRSSLMYRHPGCHPLKEEHLDRFKEALTKLEDKDKRPAGLDKRYIENPCVNIEDETHSYDKVRLIWLIWWTEWALKNCKYPAISNS